MLREVEEDQKLIRGREYCKKFNDNPDNKYFCIECGKYFHPASKNRHINTKKHQSNSQKIQQ